MAAADIIPNLITATTNKLLDPWWKFEINKSAEEREYNLVLYTSGGTYIIEILTDRIKLSNHDGEPIMADHTNMTNVTNLRNAINTVLLSSKAEALSDIDVYLSELIA